MRVSSVTTCGPSRSSSGTLKSTRTRARLPFTSTWLRDSLGMAVLPPGDVANEIDTAQAVAPLVVVPANQFEEALVYADAGASVEDTRMAVVNEISRDNFVIGISEDAFEVSLARLLHGGADFLVGSLFHRAHRQINATDRGRRHPEGHAGELSFDLGNSQADGLRCAGCGRNDVDCGRASAFPVLLRRAIHRLLRRGVTVNRGHQTLLDSETFFQEDVHNRGEAVCCTTGVGDDVMLCRIVLLVVDTHDHCQVVVFPGSGDDHLLRSRLDMTPGFARFCKQAG